MIRKCTEQDRFTIKEYLKHDAEYNTFFLADIDDFGFESDVQTVYADEQDGQLKGVYLHIYKNMLVYSKTNEIDMDFLIPYINDNEIDVVMGKIENIEEAAELLPSHNLRSQCLYILESEEHLETDETGITKAQLSEADDIFDFIQTITEIRALYTSKQMIVDRIGKNVGTHYTIRENGRIIAQANSAAASEYATMIGGVATDYGYRGHKLASRIVSRLCRDILAQGKRPCLFAIENEEHNMYVKIGFVKAGRWGTMARG